MDTFLQSKMINQENFKQTSKYFTYYNLDWSWDDNYFCTTWDNDCRFKWVYGFLPYQKEIDLWIFKDLYWSGFYIIFTWTLSNSWVSVYIRGLDYNDQYSDVFYESWYMYWNVVWDYNIKLKNNWTNWIQFNLRTINWEDLKDFDISYLSWYAVIAQELNSITNWGMMMPLSVFAQTWFYLPPPKPTSITIAKANYNPWAWCAWMGINDIQLNWKWNWTPGWTGEVRFEILSWTSANNLNQMSVLNFDNYCDTGFNCSFTGYDYITWTYYFKINTYRCIWWNCWDMKYNLTWWDIVSTSINFCP